MRILGIFLILVLSLAMPLAFSENIADIIKNENKFQFFEKPLLDLIESGEVTKYEVKILASSNDLTTQQDEIDLITSLIISNYEATEITHGQNMFGHYVQATIPVENLPLIAKLDFVRAILASNSPFVEDQSNMSVGDQIRNNPKFTGFFDHLLESIDNEEIDEIFVTAWMSQYSFDVISEQHTQKQVDKLIEKLNEEHNAKNLLESKASLTFRVDVKELPKIGQYDFVKQIKTDGNGFKNLSEDEQSGIYKASFYKHLYDVPFSGIDATFFGISSEGIRIEAEPGGSVIIDIPRELIDSYDIYGELTFFDPEYRFVNILDNFPNIFIMEDKEITCDYRRIEFTFPDGFNATSLYGYNTGSQLLFPGSSPLVGMSVSLGDIWIDKFAIETSNQEFEVVTNQNGAICDIDFLPEEKKIEIIARGHIRALTPSNEIYPNSIDVIVPNTLLSGDFIVLVDGKEVNFDIMKTMIYNTFTITHSFEKNPTVFEIVGTQLLTPPFGLPTNTGTSIPVENSDDSIKYISSEDIKIKSAVTYNGFGFQANEHGGYDVISYLLFEIDANESGELTLTIPEVFIKKNLPQKWLPTFTVDGILVNPIDTIFASNSLTVTFKIPSGTKQISILGDSFMTDLTVDTIDSLITPDSGSTPRCFWLGVCPTQALAVEFTESKEIHISGYTNLVNSHVTGIHPKNIQIMTGDTVTWISDFDPNNRLLIRITPIDVLHLLWGESYHGSDSDDGTFSHTFTEPGVYYHNVQGSFGYILVKGDLENNPISVSEINLVNSFGHSLSFVYENQIGHITAKLKNNGEESTPFVFQIDPDDSESTWITGQLESGQILSPSLSWIPKSSGLHTVTISVGTDLNSLFFLSILEIDVQEITSGIDCSDDLTLVIKSRTNDIVCVSSITADKLVQRGWGSQLQ